MIWNWSDVLEVGLVGERVAECHLQGLRSVLQHLLQCIPFTFMSGLHPRSDDIIVCIAEYAANASDHVGAW